MVLIVLGLCGLFKFISRLIIQITLTFLTYSEGISTLPLEISCSLAQFNLDDLPLFDGESKFLLLVTISV